MRCYFLVESALGLPPFRPLALAARSPHKAGGACNWGVFLRTLMGALKALRPRAESDARNGSREQVACRLEETQEATRMYAVTQTYYVAAEWMDECVRRVQAGFIPIAFPRRAE